MGFGTCVGVCVFGALSIVDGLAVVDPDKCVGCGTCVATCPKSVLALAQADEILSARGLHEAPITVLPDAVSLVVIC
jgi:Fe-S-cluster-containing hydrogenase component 2